MASIVKRNNSYSVVYYYKTETGEKRQKWETYKSYDDAFKRKQYLEQSTSNSLFKTLITFEDLVKEFIDLYGKKRWSYSTYSFHIGLIEHYMFPYLKHIKLCDFNHHMLDRFYTTLAETSSVKDPTQLITDHTIIRVHKLLKTIFRQAVLWDCMDINPADKIILPKCQYTKRNFLTMEEIDYLLQNATDDLGMSLLIQLSFACSLRKGEILGLTWNDIDFKNHCININKALTVINKDYINILHNKELLCILPDRIIVPTKTCKVLKSPKTSSSIRKVYVPDTLLKNLALYKQSFSSVQLLKDYPLIFTDAYGYPYGDNYIKEHFDKLLEKCNLPHVVFHSLRHSSITYKLLLTNGDIKSVQGDAGHAQSTMVTELYSHIIDANRKQVADKFEEAFYRK